MSFDIITSMETYRPRIVLVGPNDLNRRILGSFFEGKAEVIVEEPTKYLRSVMIF